ncbi:MAG: DNA/RNA nuclease SfsA [Desulfobacterales bacterium]
MDNKRGIEWPPLIPATLIKRYKRFLADVRLENGEIVTAHCPNSGAMTGCCEPGRKVYISYHTDPKRKLKYTWQLIHMPDSLVGVNTMIPNRLVAQAVSRGFVPELSNYDTLVHEVRVSKGSRIDLLLKKDDNDCCYVEVKNCTLVKSGKALFPDAVTLRGKKHLVELQRLVAEGHRCAMFYLIQRMDADRFSPADRIDPDYGKELRKAISNGVEALAYDVFIDLRRIRLSRKIPCYI